MKNQYKAIKIIFVLFLSMFLSGGYAMASTIEGTVQGLGCVLHGKLCPVDKNDPHLAAENVFVVYSDKNDYKIVANLNRMIISRYLGQKVRVKGDITPKYNAIEADTFEVMNNGKYKTVWTLERELVERENFLRGGGGGQ